MKKGRKPQINTFPASACTLAHMFGCNAIQAVLAGATFLGLLACVALFSDVGTGVAYSSVVTMLWFLMVSATTRGREGRELTYCDLEAFSELSVARGSSVTDESFPYQYAALS